VKEGQTVKKGDEMVTGSSNGITSEFDGILLSFEAIEIGCRT